MEKQGKYKILMIEDDAFRVESKVDEFMFPKDETRIEFVSAIRKLLYK